MIPLNTKRDHRDRKNRASREEYLRLNHEQNARRSKQVWVPLYDFVTGETKIGGFWARPQTLQEVSA